jgi:hypothetical protein
MLRESVQFIAEANVIDTGSSDAGGTDLERMAHYRQQADQFRQWADEETVPEARAGLLDMAKQYERLASELEARSRRR